MIFFAVVVVLFVKPSSAPLLPDAPDTDEENINDTINVIEEGDKSNENEETFINSLFPNLDRPVPIGASEQSREEILRLTELAKNNDDNFAVWLDLASNRKVAGDTEGAAEIWIYMTKKFPSEITPHINLGDLFHFYLKDYAQAELAYKRVTELNSIYYPAYLSLHQLYRDSYIEKADLADDILLEGLRVGSSQIPLMAQLGEYYENIGDIESAKKYYQMIVDEAFHQGETVIRTNYLEKLNNLENQ